MKRTFLYIISIFISQLLVANNTLDTYLELSTIKNGNVREITASLKASGEKGDINVDGASVQLFNLNGEEELLVCNTKTNDKGIANLVVPENFELMIDEDANMNCLVRFEGNEKYAATEEQIVFKDARIEFSFVTEDDTKQIKFKAFILAADGSETPLVDNDIYFYVPRMFSQMKIADGWLEEDGTGMVEFPNNIIGDTLGRVKVIAKIEEHYECGNIETSAITDWAVPRHPAHLEGPSRELWTPIAPRWMIITLIILLAGVWGHYIYAAYELYMIKKLSKKEKEEIE